MSKISSGNTDVSNRLSSNFSWAIGHGTSHKNPKGRPILGQDSPQLEKGSTIKEGPSSKEVLACNVRFEDSCGLGGGASGVYWR